MKKILVLLVAACAMLVSCQKEPPLKKSDDVCRKMEDAAFKKFCYDNFDSNHDGTISTKEAAEVKTIICKGFNITSIKGIEFFTEITQLDCSHNNLTSLDLSKNTRLNSLDCSYNNLTSLDVSKNTLLEYFIYNPQNTGKYIIPTGWDK